MDEQQVMAMMAMPKEDINFVPAKGGDQFHIGAMHIRILEDGSRTKDRIGCAEFTLPPRADGPPAHWHEMHDECFMVTQGKMRFHSYDGKIVDAGLGDWVTVPTRAPHTFTNPFDEEAKFICTMTPAYYINYFKLLHEISQEGIKAPQETILEAMSRYATLPAKPVIQEMKQSKAQSSGGDPKHAV